MNIFRAVIYMHTTSHAFPIQVALRSCRTYELERLYPLVGETLAAVGFVPRGKHVLVKPNLLRAHALTCTQPEVVYAACLYLLDCGAKATVGDSPGFGTARSVAAFIGLQEKLRFLNVPLVDFTQAAPRALPQGGQVRLAREALEADCILSVPRLKAHSQFGVTCSVKNCYGCVVGMRKAWLHARHGGKGNGFESAIADIYGMLPQVVALVDAVTAMHETGPSAGKPFDMGLLAASLSAVALDTQIYSLIHARPEQLPLWRILLERNVPGARIEEIIPILDSPAQFATHDFQIPSYLLSTSFRPVRLIKSLIARKIAEWKGRGHD